MKRVTRYRLTDKDVYDSYVLMYIFSAIDDPVIKFECLWLCERIRNKFLYEMENICLRELRHVKEQCWIDGDSFFPKLPINEYSKKQIVDIKCAKDVALISGDLESFRQDFIRVSQTLEKFYGKESSTSDGPKSSKYERNWLNLEMFHERCEVDWEMNQISLMFSQWHWEEEYAGDGWAEIALATHVLRNATPSNFFYIFDRTVDFVHNNGTVLEKLKTNKLFKNALDFKANVSCAKELLPLCSYEVRQLYAKAMRNSLFWMHERNVDQASKERVTKLLSVRKHKKLKDIVGEKIQEKDVRVKKSNVTNGWINRSVLAL